MNQYNNFQTHQQPVEVAPVRWMVDTNQNPGQKRSSRRIRHTQLPIYSQSSSAKVGLLVTKHNFCHITIFNHRPLLTTANAVGLYTRVQAMQKSISSRNKMYLFSVRGQPGVRWTDGGRDTTKQATLGIKFISLLCTTVRLYSSSRVPLSNVSFQQIKRNCRSQGLCRRQSSTTVLYETPASSHPSSVVDSPKRDYAITFFQKRYPSQFSIQGKKKTPNPISNHPSMSGGTPLPGLQGGIIHPSWKTTRWWW